MQWYVTMKPNVEQIVLVLGPKLRVGQDNQVGNAEFLQRIVVKHKKD